MTILITGGTGNTGAPLSRLLHDAGHQVLVASRSGAAPAPLHPVKFDWLNPSTHTNPFDEASNLGLGPINRVYLVAPSIIDMLAAMKPFIDLAIEKGVKRFVLLSASTCEMGAPAMGKVHEYLVNIKVDYCVLRPSWFFEDFRIIWGQSILSHNEIPTRTGDGKLPFIAADDIAETAVKALTDEQSPNTDWVIAGPDMITFDDAANIISEVIGRKVVHRVHSHEEGIAFFKDIGLPEGYAIGLVYAEEGTAQGLEESAAKSERTVFGKRHLRDWIVANKACWAN